jgi:hypothetical protein
MILGRAIRLGASTLLCYVPLAAAQAPPSYGFDFVTIGAPGNRPANQQEAPQLYPPWSNDPLLVGEVGYEYRIARTELTASQWFEFANTYWPYHSGPLSDLTGFWVRASNTTPGQNPGLYILPGAENKAADLSWRMAARYCNWLHNGKVNQAWAFESGAYDTSTFTRNPDGTWNDQPTHSPGALFWIPTLDEWIKAMHYDPDKQGPGQEGYWLYPHSSDSPPIPGWPWAGGQTDAGLELGSGPFLDVGSYPSVQSPWALLDGSGSQTELVEDFNPQGIWRFAKGQHAFGPLPEAFDRIEFLFASSPSGGANGVRLASGIPAPGSITLLLLVVVRLSKRRRT